MCALVRACVYESVEKVATYVGVRCQHSVLLPCLPLLSFPVPTIDGEARRYISPDGSSALTCRFNSSYLPGTTWLLNSEDVNGEGNSNSCGPTTSILTFTRFDAAHHLGAYQCQVQGLLGELVSRTIDVLPAGEW